MNKSILFLFIAFLSSNVFANTQNIDSLKLKIQSSDNGVEKAVLKLEYGWQIKYTDFEECLKITNEAMVVLTKNKQEDGLARGLSYIGIYKYLQDSILVAVDYLERSEVLLLTQNNPELLARVYNNFGVLYSALYDNETALYYYNKSLEIRKNQIPNADISSNLINISTIYYDQGNYNECIEVNEQALIYSLKNDDYESIATIYSNIGAANERLGNYKVAIKYTLNALDIYQNKAKNPSAEARTYSNLGANYLSQKLYNEARYYFKLALEINKQTNHLSNLVVSYNNMAEIERVVQNYDLAKTYALQALEIGLGLNYAEEIRISYEELSRIFEDLKDFENSLIYYKKYVTISDSMLEINQTVKAERSLAQYQLNLQKVQSKKDEKIETIVTKKVQLMYSLIVILMILFVVRLLFYMVSSNIPNTVVNILDFVIPFLSSATLAMYVLIQSSIPYIMSVFELILIVLFVVAFGVVIHLVLKKYSTCD